MIEFGQLELNKIYRCRLTKEFAVAEGHPEWADKEVPLKFTGLFFRSLKADDKLFSFGFDVIPEETLSEKK